MASVSRLRVRFARAGSTFPTIRPTIACMGARSLVWVALLVSFAATARADDFVGYTSPDLGFAIQAPPGFSWSAAEASGSVSAIGSVGGVETYIRVDANRDLTGLQDAMLEPLDWSADAAMLKVGQVTDHGRRIVNGRLFVAAIWNVGGDPSTRAESLLWPTKDFLLVVTWVGVKGDLAASTDARTEFFTKHVGFNQTPDGKTPDDANDASSQLAKAAGGYSGFVAVMADPVKISATDETTGKRKVRLTVKKKKLDESSFGSDVDPALAPIRDGAWFACDKKTNTCRTTSSSGAVTEFDFAKAKGGLRLKEIKLP